MKNVIKYSISVVLTGFGALSVFLTLSIIFDLFGIREKEGNYVLFIVYANLICGILYLMAAFQNWKEKKSSVYLLSIATIILIVAYSALLAYVKQGGIHEAKTLNAMLFRIVFTAALAGLSYLVSRKRLNN